ncbi:hypothetical protein, conserved [Plasmodium gonderi]|uniref:Uncharacterized protein n=1 Tax=Plasmodium gonderi TaxID=77519 RepID=A0A1Y1JFV3_PLAGO|nr:hypothetical protein, conserved [Plasmodium gonderi]GAW79632.1 hypothetical protein, conserved [Plasmodium gonderi]
MKRTKLFKSFCIYLVIISSLFCNCGKVRKNKKVRNLLKSLIEKVETDEGENEYARLTQSPIIHLNLSKVKFKTTLQNILVEPYSEMVKDFISKSNYEIRNEKSLLDEIKNANQNINRIRNIISARDIKKSKHQDNNIMRSRYFHYLNDEDLGLSFFPVYKTFKSNSSHFDDNLKNSLYPHELLEKGSLSRENFLKNFSNGISFPERLAVDVM